jgi:hypothetical protein
MFIQDLVMSLQTIANKNTPQKAADCYLNPACGCANPGKEIECESCEYLEGCLSRCQTHRPTGNKTSNART